MWTKLIILFLAGIAAACGSPPTSPPPAAGTVSTASLSGDWAIDFIVDGCGGHRQCVHSLRQLRTVYLRLVDEDSAIKGVFYSNALRPTTEVQGVKQGREIEVTGMTPAAFPGVAGSYAVEVMKLRARLDSDAAGEIQYAMTGVPQGDFFGRHVVTGTIVGARRLAGATVWAQSFQGRWMGEVAIRACSYTGWVACTPHQVSQMTFYELTLTESDQRLSGTMRIGGTSIAVDGVANGDVLVLTGKSEQKVSGGKSVDTLLEFNARRDKLGFLRGTLRYKDQYLTDDGREYQTTYDAIELWSVLLRHEGS